MPIDIQVPSDGDSKPNKTVALIHDVPNGHPRLQFLKTFVDTLYTTTSNELVAAINPDGFKPESGLDALQAVRLGHTEMALVNASVLESINPRAGLVNLPFCVSDTNHGTSSARARTVRFLADIVEDLVPLALVRGADQLFVFPSLQPVSPKDIEGIRIRVAGSGIYEQLMLSLGAAPVVVPISKLKTALQTGHVAGVFTSPGGWISQIGMDAPVATQVPGLMFISYVLLANKAWFESLPEMMQTALTSAANQELTERWGDMQIQDDDIIQSMLRRGASFSRRNEKELVEWKRATEIVRSTFMATYSDTAQATRHFFSIAKEPSGVQSTHAVT